MPAPLPILEPMSSLLRAVMSALLSALTEPVQSGSRRNALRAVQDDRARADARAEAWSALDGTIRVAAARDEVSPPSAWSSVSAAPL